MDNDNVSDQISLLNAHRRTLASSLQQLALQGAVFATPGLLNTISEARQQIRLIKANLHRYNVSVEDFYIDDETPPLYAKYTTVQIPTILPIHPETVNSRLETTMSNPHFKYDLSILEGNWDQERVVNSETVFIVTGGGILAELLDRPVAELLRDEIDRQSKLSMRRRGIVVGDVWWFQAKQFQLNPTISIGGPAANLLTSEIIAKGQVQESEGLYSAKYNNNNKRIALWGTGAAQTYMNVEEYIQSPEGLSSFLKLCYG